MQFTQLSLLAITLAAANAAPTSENLNFLEKRKSVNDCGPSTFVNQGSGGSPLVADCQMIARNIAGGGTFQVGCGGNAQHTKATYGTCAWGAHCDSDSANVANVGNQDIIDTINTSIDKFARGQQKVGSLGHMSCQSLKGVGSDASITWGIYHT